jgi:type IV pilus assembly protein PilQ
MRFGKVALLLTIAAATLRCSGNPPVSEPGQAAQSAPSAVVINGIDHASTPAGTEVVLHGNYPFSYTSYQPDPNTLVLEALDVQVESLAPEVSIGTPQVERVQVSSVESVDGGRIAKFEFHNILASQHAIRLEGNDLVVDFPSLADGTNVPAPPVTAEAEPAGTPADAETAEPQEDAALEPLEMPMDPAAQPAEPQPAPAAAEPAPEPLAAAEPEPASGPTAAPEPAPAAEPVQVTRGALAAGNPARTLISVQARGTDPEQAVVLTADGALAHEHFELQNPARLVLDLPGVLDRTGTKVVPVDSQILPRVRVAQFATRPRPVVRVVLDLSAPRPYAVVPTENGLVVDFSEEAVRMAKAAAAAPAPLTAEAPSTPSADVVPVAPAPEPVAAAETATDGDVTPEVMPEPVQNPLLASGDARVEIPAPARARRTSAGQETTHLIAGGKFRPRAISDTGPRYTGKRISLNFKDADLKDVFRLFHEITGYNIVLDPAVAGSLTIVLENVPEDQALDIILKNNGLDKVFENNVIRIATTQKLASEAAARKALLEAQELEQEPITFTRTLSYAKAKDVTPILKKMMSKRGDVIMDDRTNTLIITDLQDRQDPINRLIDTLDEQTPQVVIEARIVETDREFERDLGIIWGVHGEASPARGTQTNLAFPHRASLDYDVALPAPATAGTLGLSFGNVLDSVTLDMTLQAFELNGDVKVLSSPRIATQNNIKATIEQGTQIPVVSTTATQINVEFISASLKLEVTPQITNEGTVIMDIRVDNSSPDFVNRVGDVPPIITERAQTQILVADGGTAVIGGIFKLNDSVTQAGVPGLSKIPGLGWLFKSKSINRKNTELLIFITPRISKKAEPQEGQA